MKRYSIFVLIACFTPLIAMEDVNSVDSEINQKFLRSFWEDLLLPYSTLEDNVADILNLVSQQCSNEQRAEALCAQLYEKNNIFKNAVNFFVQKVRADVDSITCDTIGTTNISELITAQPLLEKLSLSMQQWLTNYARMQMHSRYDMVLIGHTDEIFSFDLCPLTGHAVTSAKDKTIRLWDLSEGKCVAMIQEDTYHVRDVCFDKKGSHIATVTNQGNKTCFIRQWKINQSAFLKTHEYLLSGFPYYISYFDDNHLLIIMSPTKTFKDPELLQCQYPVISILFTEDGQVAESGSANIISTKIWWQGSQGIRSLDFDNYHAELHQKVLSVTKHCPSLYLCQQAIKNAQQRSSLSDFISSSRVYSELTPHEQGIVMKQVQQRAEELLAIEQ